MSSPSPLSLGLAALLVLAACQRPEEDASGAPEANAATATASSEAEGDGNETATSTETPATDGDRPPSEGVRGGRDVVRETLVVVEPLSVGPIRDEVVVSARVEARVSMQVLPKLTGLPVMDVLVEEGQTVAEGDLLMTLFDTELRIAADKAEASLAEASREVERSRLMVKEEDARMVRAQRQAAKTAADLARLDGLVADGLVNLQEVEDARLTANQAADDAELARFAQEGAAIALDLAVIKETQARLEHERALTDLTHARVLAPVSGVVAERNVERGELASTSEPAFRIVDVSQPILNLRVPQDALSRLAADQPVEAVSVTDPDRRFRGIVRTVSPVLDEATGSVRVIVDLEPEPGLVPGLFCEAHIVTAARDEALLVDKRAVLYDDDQPYFFAMNDDAATVRQVAFVAGAATSTRIEILDALNGVLLTSDLDVVVVGQDSLKDGALVRTRAEPY